MANRSYLYSLDVYPNYMKPRIVGLSESEYNIPLIYRILVSVNPTATHSLIFDSRDSTAITADYAAGVEKLASFFARLPDTYREKCDAVLSFLRDEKNAQTLIHLECAEIFEMEDADLEEQNAALVAELADIDGGIEAALQCIDEGDDFDLRELDEEYWTNILYYSLTSDDENDSDDKNDSDNRGKNMEEGLKLSNAVERYALGGFVRLRGGMLKLYEDKIVLSRLVGSVEISLSELESVRATKIIGFVPAGLEFKTKGGETLRVYLSNFFTAAKNREKWLMELERYVKRG